MDVRIRKEMLMYKFAKCFRCSGKGHRVKYCNCFELCNICGENHLISLCQNRSMVESNAFQVKPVTNSTNACSSGLHAGMGGRVALQTGCVALCAEGEPQKVRVLFDAGSYRSFVTARVAQRAQLSVIRRDWLGISTFGQTSRDMHLRDVVNLKVSVVGDRKSLILCNSRNFYNSKQSRVDWKMSFPTLRICGFQTFSKGVEEISICVLIWSRLLVELPERVYNQEQT